MPHNLSLRVYTLTLVMCLFSTVLACWEAPQEIAGLCSGCWQTALKGLEAFCLKALMVFKEQPLTILIRERWKILTETTLPQKGGGRIGIGNNVIETSNKVTK